MKKIFALLLVLFLANSANAFRVVGYLPAYRFYAVNSIDFSKLTHVCVSFANPDANGVFTYSEDLTALVNKAHAKNCEVFISIGGGGLSTVIEDIYHNKTDAANRPALINSLMNFVRENNLDGVDVDLEGSMVQMATYDGFVQELIDSAHAINVDVSAAFAKWTGSSVEAATIQALDFLNLMSYDATGPWAPNSPGQHSPMSQTSGDFSYWNSRGADKGDLVIGVPFYGYEFKSGTVDAWTWCTIAQNYPNDMDNDQITTPDGSLYYNGRTTIESKVQYAVDNNAGGIMIWELGQDCFDGNSMLSVINNKLKDNNVFVGKEDITKSLSVYPNPASSHFTLADGVEGDVNIYDFTGKLVYNQTNVVSTVDVVDLKSGVYFVEVISAKTRFVGKLVKK